MREFACKKVVGLLAALGASVAVSSAAVYDYSSPLPHITVTVSSNVLTFGVFDPAQQRTIETNIAYSSSVSGLVSSNGVAAWKDIWGAVHFITYDPMRTNWVHGSSFGLSNMVGPRVNSGMVGWGVGTNAVCCLYNRGTGSWTIRSRALGERMIGLTIVDGVMAWLSADEYGYMAYDPARDWTSYAGLRVSGEIFTFFGNSSGVVAWSSEAQILSSHANVYDSDIGHWQTLLGTGPTSSMRNQDGVVAWISGPEVRFQIFDPRRHGWSGTNVPATGVSGLAISNAIVTWSSGGVNRRYGYNPLTRLWISNAVTLPLAHFSAATSESNRVVHFGDMSLGGVRWEWQFGDGMSSTSRATAHQYVSFGIFNVTQKVWNASGQLSSTNLVVKTDIAPPRGTITIDNNAALTTNQTVTLYLSASDNSGVVASNRFSNIGSNWSSWENFTTNRQWLLSPEWGLKGVRVEFSDPFGNVSAYGDSIRYDIQPMLTAPRLDAGGRFEITLVGRTNQRVGILVSETLSNWTLIMTNTNISGILQLVDPNATGRTRRFYRAYLF